MNVKTKKELVYADECYKIIGLIFEIFNKFGYGYKEKFYQKAIAEIFKKNDIAFKEQLKAKVKFGDKDIGIYFFDFLVFDKIVIEIKQKNYFSKKILNIYSYFESYK